VSVQRQPDHVLTIVEDDGCGFDPAQLPNDASRIGIAGMGERVSVVGGTLTIESKPGEGTTVRAQLPTPP
jgi:signal transduction histidine kinase